MKWNTIAHQYATACQISYYAAQADVQQRRRANGDDEAARWFARAIAGEALAWSSFA